MVGFYHHEPSWSCSFCLATVSGCNHLVVGPTLARGGTLDLLMTDVPDLVRVAVVAPIGNSDLSSLSALISMAQVVPNLCVSMNVFLKHQVKWNIVCGAIQDLPCRNICSKTICTIFLKLSDIVPNNITAMKLIFFLNSFGDPSP